MPLQIILDRYSPEKDIADNVLVTWAEETLAHAVIGLRKEVSHLREQVAELQKAAPTEESNSILVKAPAGLPKEDLDYWQNEIEAKAGGGKRIFFEFVSVDSGKQGPRFFCPYCGGVNIWPNPEYGTYSCDDCRRDYDPKAYEPNPTNVHIEKFKNECRRQAAFWQNLADLETGAMLDFASKNADASGKVMPLSDVYMPVFCPACLEIESECRCGGYE